VDLEAAKSKICDAQGGNPRLGRVLREGWYFLLPLAALVYALFGLNYRNRRWRGWSRPPSCRRSASSFPSGQRIGFRNLAVMLRDAGIAVLDLFMLGAAAGIMIGALNYSGVGFTLTLVADPSRRAGSLVALLVLSGRRQHHPGTRPADRGRLHRARDAGGSGARQDGDSPDGCAHVHHVLRVLSMISPPVAIAAFVAANLAGADPNRTGWVAMAFGWTLFVIPFSSCSRARCC